MFEQIFNFKTDQVEEKEWDSNNLHIAWKYYQYECQE